MIIPNIWEIYGKIKFMFQTTRCFYASKLLQDGIIKSPAASAASWSRSVSGQSAAAEQHGTPHPPLQTGSRRAAQQPMVVEQLDGQNLAKKLAHQTMTVKLGPPGSIAKLVNITPKSLWFMVLITVVTGVDKATYN